MKKPKVGSGSGKMMRIHAELVSQHWVPLSLSYRKITTVNLIMTSEKNLPIGIPVHSFNREKSCLGLYFSVYLTIVLEASIQ
jgi:hypothetical protein